MFLISPTTVLVAGSIRATLSPALLVWTTRTLLPSAAVGPLAPRQTSTTGAAAERITPSPFPAEPPPANPCGNRLPLGRRLRRELPPAAVKIVAARFFRERVHQQAALLRMPGHDVSTDRLEVPSRLFVVPRRGAGRQGLQVARPRGTAMTDVTASVAVAFFEEDRLYSGLEEFVVQRGRLGNQHREDEDQRQGLHARSVTALCPPARILSLYYAVASSPVHRASLQACRPSTSMDFRCTSKIAATASRCSCCTEGWESAPTGGTCFHPIPTATASSSPTCAGTAD